MHRYAISSASRTVTKSMSRLAYLDKGVVVLNKPPGLICQFDHNTPRKGGVDNTYGSYLEDAMAKYGLPVVPTPLHRLDKATTGALLFGLHEFVTRDLAKQFQARTIDKVYLAIVRGGHKSFKEARGLITNTLTVVDGRVSTNGSPDIDWVSGRHSGPKHQMKQKVAITEWELVASSPTAPLSLVRLILRTGLKHQLRIHMAHTLQVPILGDTLYSRSKLSDKITDILTVPEDIMYLHASSLSFDRYSTNGPRKKHRIQVITPLPKYFTGLCHKVGIAVDRDVVKGGVWDNGEIVPRSNLSLQRFARVVDQAGQDFEDPGHHIPGESLI